MPSERRSFSSVTAWDPGHKNLTLRQTEENLEKGLVHRSTSSAGAGFFFVEKKDKSLWPFIDYHGLNKITIPNKYPLSLITELFSHIQGGKFFTKLNL